MFKAKTKKIEVLATILPNRTANLEKDVFFGNTNIYIDYANVKNWYDKLGWHIDLERLRIFLACFDNIATVNLYHGTLIGDEKSEEEISKIKKCGYTLHTKPVKIMQHSIDARRINIQDPSILKSFIRQTLLRRCDLETVEYLNRKFRAMNQNGELYLEDRKCNFDVEIGRDMLLDFAGNNLDTFVLWSGDSDFYDPLLQLLKDKKKAVLFATAGVVSRELNALQNEGLFIFDIQKIKDFICYNRELGEAAKESLGKAFMTLPLKRKREPLQAL